MLYGGYGYFSNFSYYVARVVQCYWPMDEVTPVKPARFESFNRLIKTAVRLVRRVVLPRFNPVWSHRRWRSITSKTHQGRKN